MFRKLKEEIGNINDVVSNIQDKVMYERLAAIGKNGTQIRLHKKE